MKSIAFTFDDGPNTTVTPKIIELFEEYGGKCTFFLIGKNIDAESEKTARRAFEMGYEIENHSFTHRAFPELDEETVLEEISKTDELIEKITGRRADFFRPPYISYNEDSFRLVDKTFICGLGCDDWNSEVTVEKRTEEVLGFADDGVIVLLHDSADNYATAEALKTILPELKSRGYEFLTLKELFAKKNKEIRAYPGEIFSRI